MPNPLNSVTCGDGYTDAATISDVWNTGGGWFVVSAHSVYCEIQYGVQGESFWTLEQLLGEGASGTIGDDCTGIRFRNAVAGSNAVVSGAIANGDEPALGIINLGAIVVSNPVGLLLKTTFLTSGTSFTTGSETNQIRAQLVGGGGGGANGGGAGSAGAGGGAGGYVDTGLIPVTPSTAYAYTIGSAGVHGANGGPGSTTTLTIGANLYVGDPGQGGTPGSTYTPGGAGGPGLDPTGLGVIVPGEQGGACNTFNATTQLFGGKGGSSPYGFGGPAAIGTTAHNAGASTGYGSGGGGGIHTGDGTDGQAGLIVIEEYS